MPVINVKGFENCICHHQDLVNLYDCEIGEGTKIGAFVEIGKGVVIGKNCKIQTGAFIPEGVTIGDNVFIGPNVTFCNTKYPMTGEGYLPTMVMYGAVIGANATILPGLVIAIDSIVGAGSVVTKHVKIGTTVMGNPAKPVLRVDTNHTLPESMRMVYKEV